MYDYWEVLDPLGKKIANTGTIDDAIKLCQMRGQGHTYRKVKFIMDQVIDITSTTDKQLPGQQGLPAAKEELPPMDLQQQVWLPEGQGIPFNAK
jgi:hypothetical protein